MGQVQGLKPSPVGVVGLAFLLIVVWLLGYPGQVHACSCVVPGSPSEEIDKFDAVFAGRVVSIQHSFDPQGSSFSHGDQTTIGFQVSAVWKGAVTEDMHVTTPPTGGSCGFAFEEGEEYIVYAYDGANADESYSVNICSRTALLAQAQEDLDAFGDGEAPLTEASGPQPEGSPGAAESNVSIVILGVIAGIALIGATSAAVWVRRR